MHSYVCSIYYLRNSIIIVPSRQTWYTPSLMCSSHVRCAFLRDALLRYTMGDSDVISMPADFRRHLVGKTVINVFQCDITEIRFISKASVHTDIFINQRIECYLNNRINIRPLAPQSVMPCYTHKMAIVSWP